MARRKLPRTQAYNDFNAAARFAILRITNAIAEAKVAEQLHSSRQSSRLDDATTELGEAMVLLREAAQALQPMRAFIAGRGKRRKQPTSTNHHAPPSPGPARQEEGTEEVLHRLRSV